MNDREIVERVKKLEADLDDARQTLENTPVCIGCSAKDKADQCLSRIGAREEKGNETK
jgi:hypothetical protein